MRLTILAVYTLTANFMQWENAKLKIGPMFICLTVALFLHSTSTILTRQDA
jgi:hypothetical protein